MQRNSTPGLERDCFAGRETCLKQKWPLLLKSRYHLAGMEMLMSYELRFNVEADLLRVEIFGERPKDKDALRKASHEGWRAIARVATEQERDRLLVVSHARGDYPTVKAYEINSTLAECGVQRGWKIAFVNLDSDSFQDVKFAETVAVNRGFDIAVFRSEEVARNWLVQPI